MRSSMRFRTTKRVPFADVDAARLVFYPRYFVWFHDTFELMFESVVGDHYAAVLAKHDTGYPAVQTACEFKGPAYHGDLLDIEVFVSRMSGRSGTFEYRVRRDGALLVSASVKVATMSMSQHVSVPWPAAVAEAFAPYVEVDDDELPDTARIR